MASWQYGQLVHEEPKTVLGFIRGTQIVFEGGGQTVKFSSVQQAFDWLGSEGWELTTQSQDHIVSGWSSWVKTVYTFKRYS